MSIKTKALLASLLTGVALLGADIGVPGSDFGIPRPSRVRRQDRTRNSPKKYSNRRGHCKYSPYSGTMNSRKKAANKQAKLSRRKNRK